NVAYAGQPGRQPPVHAGAVQVGVHDVVPAGPDQPHQPRQGGHAPADAPAQHQHGRTGIPDPVRQRAWGRLRDHLALLGQPAQQQPELVLGTALSQPGDDVQDPHGALSSSGDAPLWTNLWRRRLAYRRIALSRSPTKVRGTAYKPSIVDRYTEQAYP